MGTDPSLDTLPDMQILDSSSETAKKKYDVKNVDKWRYRYLIEWKTFWEKGEIARYEQFLLFPQCFWKLSIHDASKWVSVE